MTNYEEQFDAIIAEGRVFYLDPPDSDYFRYLFGNTRAIGQDLKDDPVVPFFKSVAPEDATPETFAKSHARHMLRELQFLIILNGVIWTGPEVEGFYFVPHILPRPDVLRMILESAEGRTEPRPYRALSVDDIRALRRGYRMADSYAEETRQRRDKTPSDV